MRTLLQREYLSVRYLVDLLRAKARSSYRVYEPGLYLGEAVTYLDVERPDGLPDGSQMITLSELNTLVPR